MYINTTKENLADIKNIFTADTTKKLTLLLNGLLSPPERLILDSEYETLVQIAKYDGKKEFVKELIDCLESIQTAEIQQIK